MESWCSPVLLTPYRAPQIARYTTQYASDASVVESFIFPYHVHSTTKVHWRMAVSIV